MEENVSDHALYCVCFFTKIISARKNMINTYFQIFLLDFNLQYHVLAICDMQSDVIAQVLMKYSKSTVKIVGLLDFFTKYLIKS